MTTVPGGTGITRSLAEAAVAVGALPGSPRRGLPGLAMGQGGEAVDALAGDEDHAAAVAAVAAVGPAQGTYFSRRKLTQPSPPLPASKRTTTSSTNIFTYSCRAWTNKQVYRIATGVGRCPNAPVRNVGAFLA